MDAAAEDRDGGYRDDHEERTEGDAGDEIRVEGAVEGGETAVGGLYQGGVDGVEDRLDEGDDRSDEGDAGEDAGEPGEVGADARGRAPTDAEDLGLTLTHRLRSRSRGSRRCGGSWCARGRGLRGGRRP